jgi:phosphoglycerate dehydrogenase-like enzyme
LREIDLLVLPYGIDSRTLASLRNVRVVQNQSLGYDDMVPFIPDGVTLCNAVNVHEAPTAELALMLMLASHRGWPEVGRNQDSRQWVRRAFSGPWDAGFCSLELEGSAAGSRSV